MTPATDEIMHAAHRQFEFARKRLGLDLTPVQKKRLEDAYLVAQYVLLNNPANAKALEEATRTP